MRILKVTPAYYPYLDKGGPATKVRAMAEMLAGRGHSVTVLTTAYGPPPAGAPGKNGPVEVIYLPSLYTYRHLAFNPGVFSFCRQRLREFDLVHVYGLYDLLGPAVAAYCRRRSIPYVVEPMGMYRPIDRNYRMKRLWHDWLGESLLRGAALLIATSGQERGELREEGFPEGAVVLRYNGITREDFRPLPPRGAFRKSWELPAREPMVLFLGRLIPRKRAGLLLEVFADTCAQGRLVIAGPEGEPGYLEKLRSEVQARGLNGRVLFPGPLYGRDKLAALVDADVFVLPSEYENFANAAAEAIACGTPVIVTDRCGISELVDQRAGLVIPCDRPALAAALRMYFQDPGLRERLRAGCAALAEELDWERLIGQQELLYRRVLENARAGARAGSFYDEHPFDWVPHTDLAEVRTSLAPLLRQMADELPAGALVLDVGCGPGRLMSYLAAQGRRAIGVDLSLHSARSMAQRCGRPGMVADNLCLPLRDGAADAVISDGVLHHTADSFRAYTENCRVLRPGGRMYLAVYRPGGHYPLLYRFPGSLIRLAVRRGALRWLVHATVLPLYYAVHAVKSRGRRTWRGARNLFYDYFVSPRVEFLSRRTIEEWCRRSQMKVRACDPARGNVHCFVLEKQAGESREAVQRAAPAAAGRTPSG